MKRQLWLPLLAALAAPAAAFGQFAAEVIEYVPGDAPAFRGPSAFTNDPGFFDLPEAALGAPTVITGEGEPLSTFGGITTGGPTPVSVFNAPILRNEIVSIGEGGSLTLRLSNFASPVNGPELGFFTNVTLLDNAFPNGLAGDPVGSFGGNQAEIEVSEDGVNFVSLGVQALNTPTQAFSNPSSSVLSDPNRPFTGTLADFAGLPFSDPNGPDILDILDGSAGGFWIDIEPSGLPRVGFVRLSVPDDGFPPNNLLNNFELDAVSIAAAAVPEPAALALVAAAWMLAPRRRRPA